MSAKTPFVLSCPANKPLPKDEFFFSLNGIEVYKPSGAGTVWKFHAVKGESGQDRKGWLPPNQVVCCSVSLVAWTPRGEEKGTTAYRRKIFKPISLP